MHRLHSGAQNQQPAGAFGGLMTLIMAEKYLLPVGRGAADLVGS